MGSSNRQATATCPPRLGGQVPIGTVERTAHLQSSEASVDTVTPTERCGAALAPRFPSPLTHLLFWRGAALTQLPPLSSCSVQLCRVTGDAVPGRERDCHPSRGRMPAGDDTASLHSTPAAYSPRHLRLCTSLPGTGRMGLSEVSLCKVSLACRKSAQRRQIC